MASQKVTLTQYTCTQLVFFFFFFNKTNKTGTSLAVQWLRLCTPNAGGPGSIPRWGTKVLHATECSQKLKLK